jgi:hypothetical protein
VRTLFTASEFAVCTGHHNNLQTPERKVTPIEQKAATPKHATWHAPELIERTEKWCCSVMLRTTNENQVSKADLGVTLAIVRSPSETRIKEECIKQAANAEQMFQKDERNSGRGLRLVPQLSPQICASGVEFDIVALVGASGVESVQGTHF